MVNWIDILKINCLRTSYYVLLCEVVWSSKNTYFFNQNLFKSTINTITESIMWNSVAVLSVPNHLHSGFVLVFTYQFG